MYGRVLLILLLLLPVMAAEKKPKAAKPAEPTDLKTLMTTRGEVLFQDLFQPDTFSSIWAVHGGDWNVVDGALRGGDRPGGGHHPQIARRLAMHDVVVQFRFRIDGASWMGFSFTDKEHVLRVMIGKEHFDLVKMSGIGGTTKGERLDRQAMKWEPGRWYTMLIELRGSEVVAQIDNQWVLYGSSPGLDIDKGTLLLINGGSHAWFDDLTIWKAEAEPKWEQRLPLVLQQKEKRK
jgi:hypothetical protein